MQLLLIPVAFFVQTLLHELAHAVAVWSFGGQVESFRPYPHKADGRMFFGRITYRILPTRPRIMLIQIAPILMSSLLVVCFSLAAGLLLQAPWPLLVFGTAAWVDVSRGLLQPLWAEHGDLFNAAFISRVSVDRAQEFGILMFLALSACWGLSLWLVL